MRYSMLVYLSNMVRTLMEAADYLDSAPAGAPLREELSENGKQMISQIRTELMWHEKDLASSQPLDLLNEISQLWTLGDKGVREALEGFFHCLQEETRYQIRAVFFTGLGSTWDAMQSVYEYMRDDPRFDPVVVLIPIFRQVQQDGQIKQEVTYVDYLTPMGIQFLEYTQYSLDEDCPDVAFINQPYESCTLPQFWPETIAKQTRLVYLPYYLPDIVANTTPMSLAKLPVYRFAWKVVCPTEKQLRFYRRHAANQGANAMLVGLPKTDPLVALKGKNMPWPKNWRHLEGKTIFLWNSWYDAGVSSLRFFHELLEWFSAHKDCGMIWRPHPMTNTVTKLHYPNLYSAYKENLQQAKLAENIVLDTEISYMAAFSASSALISDYSSLLPQYLFLDKPAVWIESNAFQFTGEEFIESSWIERAETIDDVYDFMERVRKGEDRNAELRSLIRQRDLPLADGHCGERVCELVWRDMHREDFGWFLSSYNGR